MKKLIMILGMMLLTLQGCVAQKFDAQPPRIAIVTAKVQHTSPTGSVVHSNEFNAAYRIDKEFEQDKEYVFVLSVPHTVSREKVIDAVLIDYRISEEQARKDVLEMLKKTNYEGK